MPEFPKLLSAKAASTLANHERIRAEQTYIAPGGPLSTEIPLFLAKVASRLKRDCGIPLWRHRIEEYSEDTHWVWLYPSEWEIGEAGQVAFAIGWGNPFAESAEDLAVSLWIPWNWCGANELLKRLHSLMPTGFTNVYEYGESDPSAPYWAYIPFAEFVQDGRIDLEEFYKAIQIGFQEILALQPTIDSFLQKSPTRAEARVARRSLGQVAVLDTETVGDERELVELAVVLAAYDRDSGEVLGILDQYEALRETSASIGFGARITREETAGKSIDEQRFRELVAKADFVVAHNAAFDRDVLKRAYPWSEQLDWRCSLYDGIPWPGESRALQEQLALCSIDCGEAHRAGSDARALLELLSYVSSSEGVPYLKLLMASKPISA